MIRYSSLSEPQILTAELGPDDHIRLGALRENRIVGGLGPAPQGFRQIEHCSRRLPHVSGSPEENAEMNAQHYESGMGPNIWQSVERGLSGRYPTSQMLAAYRRVLAVKPDDDPENWIRMIDLAVEVSGNVPTRQIEHARRVLRLLAALRPTPVAPINTTNKSED